MAGRYTLLNRQHVCSDVIYRLLSVRVQAFCDAIVWTLGILVLAHQSNNPYRRRFIDHSALPFIALQIFGLGLIVAFPSIALWLPSLLLYQRLSVSYGKLQEHRGTAQSPGAFR